MEDSDNSYLLNSNEKDTRWILFYTRLAGQIDLFFNAICTPVGILSNLAAYYIYSRPNLNHCNIGILSRCLCVINIITLFYALFIQQSYQLFGFDFSTYSDTSCQFLMYSRRLIRAFPPMMETLITVDRFVFIVLPCSLVARFLAQRANLAFIIYVIIFFYMLIHIENLYYYIHTSSVNDTASSSFIQHRHHPTNLTNRLCVAPYNIVLAGDVIMILLRSFIPITIMLILNWLIVRKLMNSRKVIAKNLIRSSNNILKRDSVCTTINKRNSTKREARLTKSIILMNVTFIIFNVPTSIVYAIRHAYLISDATTELDLIKLEFAWTIGFNLTTLYYASFFVLSLYFNKLFRVEARQIMHPPTAKVNPIISTTTAADSNISNANPILISFKNLNASSNA